MDALDFLEKLTGGTGTLIRFRGQLGLEVCLDLLWVLGGSGRSVTRRHLGIVRERTYMVSGLYTNCGEDNGEGLWKVAITKRGAGK